MSNIKKRPKPQRHIPSNLRFQKMAVLLEEASNNLAGWSLMGHRPGKVVTACDLRLDGKEALIQLAPVGELNKISIPFDPSSFKNHLPRKGISFNIPEPLRLQLEAIEERAKALLCSTWPDSQWHSSLKLSERYPTSLRCKIRVRGPRACRCYDPQGNPLPLPEAGQWEGLKCVPQISIGAYAGDGQIGLLLDV